MSLLKLSDHELVQLYVNGDENGLVTLLSRHKSKIFTSISIVVRDRALAEDIFQETFFKVIQTLKKGQYSEEGKFLPWVIRIARNLMIDHFRKVRKMPPLPVYVNSEGEEVSVFYNIAAEGDETGKDLPAFKREMRAIINDLPADQREVVLMRIYYDMSFKEIAEFTNVSINTALGRMRYALFNLRKMIDERKLEVLLKD